MGEGFLLGLEKGEGDNNRLTRKARKVCHQSGEAHLQLRKNAQGQEELLHIGRKNRRKRGGMKEEKVVVGTGVWKGFSGIGRT